MTRHEVKDIQTLSGARGKSAAPLLEKARGFLTASTALGEAQGGASRAYLVGGYLRDLLLGRSSTDVDVVVRGDALSVARRLAAEVGGAFVPLDPERGVARVVVPDSEGGCTWHVDVVGMQGSLEEDLARRDFTINAMALPVEALSQTGPWHRHIVDPLGGLRDLESGTLRLVGEEALEEDPARLLRAPRLAAELSFTLERETGEAVHRHGASLGRVSPERVREEFLRLLALPGAVESLLLLDELGLLTRVVPELEAGRGVTQPPEHHWDVLRHGVEIVGAVEEVCRQRPSPRPGLMAEVPWGEELAGYFRQEVGDGHSRLTLLKLGALLHDLAKPAARSVEATGRIRFLGHHRLGAEMAEAVCRRLRLSTQGTQLVVGLVGNHLRPSQMGAPGSYPTPHAVYRFFRDVGDAAVDVLFLALADYLAARGPHLDEADWRQQAGQMRYILEQGRQGQEPRRKPRLVTGHDLMAALGLEPGPGVGWLLEQLQEAQAVGRVTTREEALALGRRLLAEGAVEEERT